MERVDSPCFRCESRAVGCHSICASYKGYQQKISEDKALIQRQKEAELKSMNARSEKWTTRWKKQR